MAGQGKVWSQHGDHIPQGQPWSHYGTKSPRITEVGKDLQHHRVTPWTEGHAVTLGRVARHVARALPKAATTGMRSYIMQEHEILLGPRRQRGPAPASSSLLLCHAQELQRTGPRSQPS